VTYSCEKIQRFFRRGLIVMSDLPRWKKSKRGSHCNGWPIQVEKYRVFFGWPNSHGQPAQVMNFSKMRKFSKVFPIFGHFQVAFLWWIPSGISLVNLCKTHCSISQSLDDMHAFLPDLKYRPLFFLNFLVAWLVRTCYLWFGSSLSFGFEPTRVSSCKYFSRFVTQLSLHGAHRDPFAC
jgi:hypothetical protein